MAVQTQIQTRRGTAASWTSTNPTLAAGEIGFETDTGKFKIGNGSTAWASLAYSAGATAVTYLFNATGGQTTFSGTDANGLTLAYTVGAEQVYLNGVLQVRGSDYTATNGTSIVLASGALVSDVLNVIAYSAMTITDTYTQAQADAKFFQTANAFLAGKNKIINGDFGIWQRGTSFSNPAIGAYLADRWKVESTDAYPTTQTVSRQTFTPGTAPVAGYEGQYFFRSSVTTAGSSTYMQFSQKIENVQTFAGQTTTLSFWAKADSARVLSLYVVQDFGSGGSSPVLATVSPGTVTLSTSWQRFSVSVIFASVSGKTIGTSSNVTMIFTQPIANGSVLDIWGVQVEAGSIATPFQTATGTIQGELAACQRYYFRYGGNALFEYFGNGFANSTTNILAQIKYPVTMRVIPAAIDYSTLAVYDGTTLTAATSLALSNAGKDVSNVSFVVASGLTANRPYAVLTNNSTSGFLGFSAEL
jgi:hypothetical protein